MSESSPRDDAAWASQLHSHLFATACPCARSSVRVLCHSMARMLGSTSGSGAQMDATATCLLSVATSSVQQTLTAHSLRRRSVSGGRKKLSPSMNQQAANALSSPMTAALLHCCTAAPLHTPQSPPQAKCWCTAALLLIAKSFGETQIECTASEFATAKQCTHHDLNLRNASANKQCRAEACATKHLRTIT